MLFAMIVSFVDKTTEKLFRAIVVKKLPGDVQNKAFNKLAQIDDAASIDYLRIPRPTGSKS